MRKHIQSTSLPVFALSLVVLGTMLPGAQARAAEDCIAAPNTPAPAGQHWWYRTDRAAKRKCWFLGPQDKEAAARKADRQERGAPAARPDAADGEAQPEAAREAPPVSAARSDADGTRQVATATAQETPFLAVPYLVDWSGLLQEAGIVSPEEKALTGLADDKAAPAPQAMRDQPVHKPADAQAEKDEARAPQMLAGRSDIASGLTNSLAATPAQMPATFIAALAITGGLCLTIFSIVRAQRRQNVLRRNMRRHTGAREIEADQGALPAFLQSAEAVPVAYDQDDDQAYVQARDQDYGRGYGGEAELRRILEGAQRRAA